MILGYEAIGYWDFFASDEAPKIIEQHSDSFLSLMFARDPLLWKEHVGPKRALKEWLLADKKAEVWISEKVSSR
jgi:soluble epoxide hydrolase / lipid-phosphate phosphatase